MKDVRETRSRAPKMEGALARWYARNRGSTRQMAMYRRQAAALTSGLADGAAILEVAPGPGYHAIEMARLGRYRVTGMDISRTFLQIASDNARRAGVEVDFRYGDAEQMPFADGSFDLLVCQAAFKNFGQPLVALNEMCRVLREGGVAVVQDMSRDATGADIARETRNLGVSRVNGFLTRVALTGLRRRALSPAGFERLAAASAFGGCEIRREGVGLEIRLTRRASAGGPAGTG